jgi:biofilm protein TabA
LENRDLTPADDQPLTLLAIPAEMVLDALPQLKRYLELDPAFRIVAGVILSRDLGELAPDRYEIDGPRVWLSVDHKEGRGRGGAQLESHRRHIDIQVTIAGHEEIGWKPVSACHAPIGAFDEQRDIQFYEDAPSTWLAVPPGYFAIFFPQDAHAPLAGDGFLKKAIFKIAVRSDAQ